MNHVAHGTAHACGWFDFFAHPSQMPLLKTLIIELFVQDALLKSNEVFETFNKEMKKVWKS